MTPEEPIHVWFCSPDAHFGEVIGRALGAGFELRVNDRLNPTAAKGQQGWWDVVLLDSRHAENGTSVDAVLTLMDEIKQVSLPPPIMVMMGNDDPTGGALYYAYLRAMDPGGWLEKNIVNTADEHPEVATIGHHGTFLLGPSCHTHGTLGGIRSSVLQCRREVAHALAPQ
jgi:hypothetical protein